MKSLEIVNKWGTQLEGIKKCIEEDINKGVSWFNYEKLYKYLEDAETIKSDLEVLEILKDLFKKPSREYIGNDFGVMINEVELYMKNKEDFHKVKQWLEENENDR